jgi:hypothetical protein
MTSTKAQDDLEDTDLTLGSPDAQFGGTDARKRLERSLLRKLDTRMTILLVIYILNYVCLLGSFCNVYVVKS